MRKIFKYICFKIYAIGKVEYSIRIKKILRKGYDAIAEIDPSASITAEGTILNHQNNKRKIVIGKNSVISGNIMLFKHGGEVIIGEHSFVGPDSKIWSAKKIIVGNRVLISHNVNIHDNISHPLDAKLRHEDFKHIFSVGLQSNIDLREAEVIIEDDAWIGFNSIILKGVRIGKGAIIGAGTIITQNVPDYAVVVGNPARIIKYLEQ